MIDTIWIQLRQAALRTYDENSFLRELVKAVILDSPDMATGLSRTLSRQQIDIYIESIELQKVFSKVYAKAPELVVAAAYDLSAVMDRDPAASDILFPFLHFKGYHALQTHRIALWFWEQGQKDTAVFLQNRSSVLHGVDFHPAAKIGKGIILDHAHGIVIGETAVIEDDVSMLHDATLGCKGNQRGDRHPKIRQGVSIGAGAIILGNIEIGKGATIGAGSVVLEDVPPNTTVVGVPAKIVGTPLLKVPVTGTEKKILANGFDALEKC
jgi:serine O-acetyltransferase